MCFTIAGVTSFSIRPSTRWFFVGSLALYAVVLFASIHVLKTEKLLGFPLIAVAVAPMLPALGVAAASIIAYRQLDELQRRITAEGIMVGFVFAAVTTFTYGFLENVSVVPTLSAFVVWPLLAAGWLVGTVVAKRRYR